MEKLEQILTSLGLVDYLENFRDNDIDDSLLDELDATDLKEIGITSLGHRKKILAAIADDRPAFDKTPAATEKDNDFTAHIAERREVTTLFADLTGYTNLTRTMETEDLHNLLSVFYEIFNDIVQRFGGTVERHIGDCVMAVFGAPVSYGNDAEHALRAALEMHHAMDDISSRFGRPLSVHVGVASGNVLFSAEGRGALKELDFSLTGDSVNLASRLADQAEPEQTLITERVSKALGNQIDCDSPGEIDVKGFDQPVSVSRFLGFSDASSQQTVIGRAEETGFFQDQTNDCLAQGTGAVIALVAEAGLGKSTLVSEFENIAQLKGFVAIKSLVLDFGLADSQNPIRTFLAGISGITDSDPDDIFTRAIKLEALAGDEQARLFLAALLGGNLDEESRGVYEAMGDDVRLSGIRRMITLLLEEFAARRPLLLIIEDIHWAEQETLDHLAAIAAAASASRILLLVTFRPEKDPLDEAWRKAAGDSQIKRLELEPLGIEESLKLAQNLENPLTEEVIRACIARAEGNPLFLEQLLRHASDDGGQEVPGSIQSIVQAKLDRLEFIDRIMLEAAAVMGQQFSMSDVKKIIEKDPLDESHLVDAALIRSIRSGYLFAHALIRDAVLRTILRDELRKYHLKAASLFEGKDLVLYAEHLGAANDEQASQAYLDAAEQARARHRKEATLSLVQRGLDHVCTAKVKIGLLSLKGEMLRDLGRGSEAISAFESIIEIAEEALDRCRAQIGIVATMRIMDRIEDAFALLDEAEQVAKDSDLLHELSEIHYYRGSLHFPRGNLEECLVEHNKSLEYAEHCGNAERRALALSGLGDAHYASGKMYTAHEVIAECLELCKEHHLLAVQSANRFMLATVKIYLNEITLALAEARASSELAATVGHSRAEIVSRLTTGWILATMHKLDDAEAEINKGLRLAEKLGAKRFEPFLEESLANIALESGDAARAYTIARQALEKLRKLDAMTFIGPWLLSTTARATTDAEERKKLLEEGEALLKQGCVGHNYYRFFKNAMEASLDAGEWAEANRYADCLEEYTRQEPTPWSVFYIERTRAIVDAETGKGSREKLDALLDTAESSSLISATGRIVKTRKAL